MPPAMRIMKKHPRVTYPAPKLRGHADSARVTSAGANRLLRSPSCLVVCLCAWIGLVDVKEAVA